MTPTTTRAQTVPSLSTAKQPRNPISRKQVERVISRSVAVFGLVFGIQSIPWMLGQLDEARPLWLWLVLPAMGGSLMFVFVASVLRVAVLGAHGCFAMVYVLVLATWPLAVLPGVEVFPGIHWLNYTLTVATATAAIAFSTRTATFYLFGVALIYTIIRMTYNGGGASWQSAVSEGLYAIILGAAILIIVTMLRAAASAVDSAQAAALDRYGRAVRQHATEVERVQVDSIVHDSVLTTLISAARAFTPEAQALASTMAGHAIGHLREAASVDPDDSAMMRFSDLATRVRDAATELSGSISVRARNLGTGTLPVAIAETLFSAAVQAMVNSRQHAGDGQTARWVHMRGLDSNGIEIAVGDTGVGFVPENVPEERLGVRVSILERVAMDGGLTTIESAPGRGTVVSIRWPEYTSSGGTR